jgi:hypothetical protein
MLGTVLLLAGLAAAADGSPSGRWYVPPRYQQAGWQVRCRAGTDGFAANCEANLLAGEYWYRIVVADAQITYQVRHDLCSAEPVSFPREVFIGLPGDQRRAQGVSAFDIVTARLRANCPSLPPAERDLRVIPDVAVAGDDELR